MLFPTQVFSLSLPWLWLCCLDSFCIWILFHKRDKIRISSFVKMWKIGSEKRLPCSLSGEHLHERKQVSNTHTWPVQRLKAGHRSREDSATAGLLKCWEDLQGRVHRTEPWAPSLRAVEYIEVPGKISLGTKDASRWELGLPGFGPYGSVLCVAASQLPARMQPPCSSVDRLAPCFILWSQKSS